ncbi:ribonuclease domain-containing protein [Desulfomonile tiedjei]|uniref:Guanyl-specific ribonuclease Sa n=1 Tax=Desulfomonile tiedjei (strain ATCC 49306 / DSM 6799 / DCB-1) TaxID=706587 RepID=I4C6Y8_DESTA|nr:ribonuclease domain-containing protein [Desulfomonile tiedjei]AFM25329.1 guanyl-specific ribonuclease Sa [Desulfomonile tiedjei DSM 6799]
MSCVKYWILLLALTIACALPFTAQADSVSIFTADSHHSTQAIIKAGDLPHQAQNTLALIKRGGPFSHPEKDGTVFGNREGRLPHKPRGYYREYTVPTPGVRGRGARRIVAGSCGEFYYTDDHYTTFRRILE